MHRLPIDDDDNASTIGAVGRMHAANYVAAGDTYFASDATDACKAATIVGISQGLEGPLQAAPDDAKLIEALEGKKQDAQSREPSCACERDGALQSYCE